MKSILTEDLELVEGFEPPSLSIRITSAVQSATMRHQRDKRKWSPRPASNRLPPAYETSATTRLSFAGTRKKWSCRWGLNPWSSHYQCDAFAAKLQQRVCARLAYPIASGQKWETKSGYSYGIGWGSWTRTNDGSFRGFCLTDLAIPQQELAPGQRLELR